MPALDLEGKVCPRHPTEQAIARCFACFKPVCGECLVEANGHEFCSEKCAESHAKTSKSFEEFTAAERRQRKRRMIRNLCLAVVFLIAGYVAITFWIHNPDTVDSWISVVTESIMGIVDSVKEIVQGFTG